MADLLGAKRQRRSQPSSGAIALRQERRERNAKLRDGEAPLPPPVVGYDVSMEHKCLPVPVGGLTVHFPVQPLPSQQQVMEVAMKALESESCGLLESPTGTGKTLALMSACLAFQQHCDQDWHSKGCSPPPAPAIHTFKPAEQGAANGAPRPPPRVVWLARTHEQLQHAIAELRRLPYRPMEALRISRERFCLHPFVQQAEDRTSACELATMTRQGVALGGGQTGCEHLDNAEAIGYPNAPRHRHKFEAGGPLAVHDIEDLVKEGHATKTCPYHAAMDLTAEGAGIIFANYPFFLDPCVRMTSSFDVVLDDAVVVVDEAHNLPQAARDAASFRASVLHLDRLLTNVSSLAMASAEVEAVRLSEIVSAALTRLRDWLRSAAGADAPAPVQLRDVPGGRERRDVDGRGCLLLATVVAALEGAQEIDKLLRMLKALRQKLIEHGLEGWAVRSSAINDMDNFLRKMSLIIDEAGQGGYALIVTRPEPGGSPSTASVAMVSLTATTAFGPAAAKTRCVLMTSGTLAPFDMLKRELGIGLSHPAATLPMPISTLQRQVQSVEAVQNAGWQERLAVLAFGIVDNVRLNSTQEYRRQHSKEYFLAAGHALASLLPSIPNGCLVFFPSRAQLREAAALWRERGLITFDGGSETLGRRPAIIESEIGGEAAATAVQHYRALAGAGGAVMLAVMRGRCAEGVDFKDELARGVVVLGVPYPALDTEVRLKKEFERQNGGAWYEAEAHRAVSQVAGRLLRHCRDYGSLVLLDERFSRRDPPRQLSGWLRVALQQRPQVSGVADGARLLQSFFASRGQC